MRIGVIGNGVVGGTMTKYVWERTKFFEVVVYDPGQEKYAKLDDCDFVFIAVPINVKGFEQDQRLVEESIERFPGVRYFFVRSTVTPGTCDRLTTKFQTPIISMPEFLTERRAYADFLAHKTVIGLPENIQSFQKREIKRFCNSFFSHKDIKEVEFIKAKEAEMIKLAHNCAGAVKVTYFNAIKNLCDIHEIDYEVVKDGVGITGFINKEHTSVPGPDGKHGFGGKCFPNNLESMIGFARSDISHSLWACVWKMNDYYRNNKGERT
jgi:UDP-glucose 6-dehydrogenase